MKFPEKVKTHIVNWLKNYLIHSKQNGFVVGVSGGVDSALTSTLCALSNFPVYAIKCLFIKILKKFQDLQII